MTFTERMSSMLNPDVLSAAIKEQQSAEDTGSYGRMERSHLTRTRTLWGKRHFKEHIQI